MNAVARRERLMELLEKADGAVSATALAHTLSVQPLSTMMLSSLAMSSGVVWRQATVRSSPAALRSST